jgi:hypothetical protein
MKPNNWYSKQASSNTMNYTPDRSVHYQGRFEISRIWYQQKECESGFSLIA